MRENYWVYIMASARNGTLYIGMTNDLLVRVGQHRDGIADGFTKKYGVKMLVYSEIFIGVQAAIQRETRPKKWKRCWKLELIEKQNPDWKDFGETLTC